MVDGPEYWPELLSAKYAYSTIEADLEDDSFPPAAFNKKWYYRAPTLVWYFYSGV